MCFWRRKKKVKEEVEEKKVEEVKEEKPEPVEEKPEAKKEPEKKAPAPKKEEPKEEQERDVKDIYHISQNKDKKSEHHGRWRVRKQGSDKTIQYFDTQAQAIEFAKDLAAKADGSIVIHKRDGSIRKQKY